MIQTSFHIYRYLVRINVPTQYLENPEIRNIYKNYLQVMDTFKKTHMVCTNNLKIKINQQQYKYNIAYRQG